MIGNLSIPAQLMDTPVSASTRELKRWQFGTDFRWGSATSSYQIEGAVTEDGRGESIWDRFTSRPGTIRDGSSGAVACDHYHRWPADLDLMKDLGLDAYRFSVAWPRIYPQGRGSLNSKGLDFYSRLVDGLLERGIEPWITLYHWDLPQALQDEGGWANRRTIDAFVDYADTMSRHLGDRVKHWITHNEPWCTAFLGNFEGNHAPGLQDEKTAFQVCHHLLVSHGKAVPVIRNNVPDGRVGITLSLHPLKPASDSAADAAATVRHDGLRNRWFLDPLYGKGYPADTWQQLGGMAPQVVPGDIEAIAAPTDFLGVNYYFPETVADAPAAPPINTRVAHIDGLERTAFGWEVSPEGLTELLVRIQRDYQPSEIYITENGSTYDDVLTPDGRVDDTKRCAYLIRHLQAARETIALGVPLKGYFAWSLLDNFEWAEGYTRRFGLTYIDFATQQRILKTSGNWFRQFLHASS